MQFTEYERALMQHALRRWIITMNAAALSREKRGLDSRNHRQQIEALQAIRSKISE